MKISAEKTINVNFAFTSDEAVSLKQTLEILEDFKMFIYQELHQQYELTDFINAIYDDFTEFIEELIYRPASVETYLAEFIEKKGKEIAF
jgi:hypothetical protein